MSPVRTIASAEGLERTAFVSVMLLPLLLLHAHGLAEIAIALADLCFLVRCTLLREWRWLRSAWLRVAALWWGWLVFCSLPLPLLHLGEGGVRSFVQAVVMVRFLLLLTTLEHLVLRSPGARTWMFRVVAASAAWIGLNSVIQDLIGYNLFGWPRSGDGELTGPFRKPRAGPPLARILIPAILPPAAWLLARRGLGAKLGAYALLLGGVLVMVLIGQRMPLAIVLFGLVVVALVMPRFRPVVLAAGVAGAVLLAASPVVAPSAYYRLVEKFSTQMEHFSISPYGKLYARAWAIGIENPVTGLGFDGFATGCPQPAYFHPTFDGSLRDGGGAQFCWDHPHNHYLQALDDSGFVGLLLFTAMGLAWLATLGRGLWRHPEPVRVALFAAAALSLWPIQSATAFNSMPVGGWFFLLIGWGLAESRWTESR